MHIPLVDLKAQHDYMKKELEESLKRVIDNSSFIMGEEVKNFERDFAKYCDSPYCVGASNGSTALYTVLKAMGLKQGDEVIMPVNTFVATAFSVTLLGGKPVFVDVNQDDYLINTKLIEKSITSQTKVIIPVHLYGSACNMDEISKIAKKHNLLILEDCAQAHGTKYKGNKVPVTQVGCFSFFPAKVLGCFGDAGGIVSRDEILTKTCAKIVNHGRVDKYVHDIEGFNFRLSSLQAAILSSKLKHLASWVEKRRTLAERYSLNLKGVVGLPYNSKDSESCFYMYVIRLKNRDNLQKYLKEKGIDTGIHYPVPLHLQPVFKNLGYQEGDFPIAEKQAKEILSIPMYPELTFEQQDYIIKEIKNFISSQNEY